MSKSCKGACDTFQNQRKGYSNGQKFCKVCDKYLATSDLMCSCCKNWLRCSKRHNKQTSFLILQKQ